MWAFRKRPELAEMPHLLRAHGRIGRVERSNSLQVEIGMARPTPSAAEESAWQHDDVQGGGPSSAAFSTVASRGPAEGFVEGLAAEEEAGDVLAYMERWGGSNARLEKARREIDSKETLQEALLTICSMLPAAQGLRRDDSNAAWARVWRVVCDQVRSLLPRSDHEDIMLENRRCCAGLVDDTLTCEFVEVARRYPNSLASPLMASLRDAAAQLQLHVLSQLLVQPSEGFFILWWSTLWEEKKKEGVLPGKKSFRLPSPPAVAGGLLHCHLPEEIQYEKTVKNFRKRQGNRRPSWMSGDGLGGGGRSSAARAGQAQGGSYLAGEAAPSAAGPAGSRRAAPLFAAEPPQNERVPPHPGPAQTPESRDPEEGEPQGHGQGRAASMVNLFKWHESDDEDNVVGYQPWTNDAASPLDALCRALHIAQHRGDKGRMQRILTSVMGSPDAVVELVAAVPQLFLAFTHEEEANAFLRVQLHDLDTKQMMSFFEAIQAQLQRFIRYHTNPLFSCLDLASSVRKLASQSHLMKEVWEAELARLKKATTQIFELLPDEAFNRIFASMHIRQAFNTLAFREAEVLELMDTPRFKDYLRARWQGGLPALETVRTGEDYLIYWDKLLDMNTLIFSPRLRIFLEWLLFTIFTVILHFLRETREIAECALVYNFKDALMWVYVVGHSLRVLAGMGSASDLVLMLLFITFFAHCASGTFSLDLPYLPLSHKVSQLVIGLTEMCMVLRSLRFLSAFTAFGALLKSIEFMMKDMLHFLTIYGIFMVSFAMLFERLRPEDPDYKSFIVALVTMFCCSLMEFEGMENLKEETSDESAEVRFLGYAQIVFLVTFLLISAVLLLNLLISIMNATYNDVTARGNKESSRAFLESIEDGEKHAWLDMGSLPPPLNVCYVALLFAYGVFEAVYLMVYSLSCSVLHGGCQEVLPGALRRFRFRLQHQAPPMLIGFIFFPLTLLVVVLATLPCFLALLLVAPRVPFGPAFLEGLEGERELQHFLKEEIGGGGRDLLQWHLLLPSRVFASWFKQQLGDRLTPATSCPKRLALSGLCVVLGLLIFFVVMPLYWIYEAANRWLTSRAGTVHLQLSQPHMLMRTLATYHFRGAFTTTGGAIGSLAPDSEDRSNMSEGDQQAELDERQKRKLLELLNSGQLLIAKGHELFDYMMSDGMEKPMQGSSSGGAPSHTAPAARDGGLSFRSSQRRRYQTLFTRDTHTLDLAMLWAFERNAKSPGIMAVQFERVFNNLHSHEERVEDMLRSLLHGKGRAERAPRGQ